MAITLDTQESSNAMIETIVPQKMSSKPLSTVIGCHVDFFLGGHGKEYRDSKDMGTVSLISDSSSEDGFRLHYYTRSEIRKHNTEASAWIVAGEDVYDVTDYVEHHPGGKYSIMKKVGGEVDCTRDLLFHSKSGQKYWKRFLIGKVTKTPSKNRLPVEKEWWKFWE